MRRFLAAWLLFPVGVGSAWAHPMPNSAVVLRLGPGAIDAELTLPLGELASGWDRPLPHDPAEAIRQYGGELSAYVRSHVQATAPDGRAWSVRVRDLTPIREKEPDIRVGLALIPPPGAPVDRLTLRYDVIFHRLVTHTAMVSLAGDWRHGVTADQPVLLGTLRDTRPEIAIDRSGGSWGQGFAAMARLGARHIAEGADHLLFLLALLLPAPLVAEGGRWRGYAGGRAALRRIVRIVSAFTLGHSVTLAIGAVGWARLSDALVESVIALSVLVSAIHALVPIFRGREVWIAGGFGLVHGLAFAATLDGFGLDPWTVAASVLGFNLGIELFQLLVILAALPTLLLLARSGIYRPVRVAGAGLTAVAATVWFWDRAVGGASPAVAAFVALAVLACVAIAVRPRLGTPAPRPGKSWSGPATGVGGFKSAGEAATGVLGR